MINTELHHPSEFSQALAQALIDEHGQSFDFLNNWDAFSTRWFFDHPTLCQYADTLWDDYGADLTQAVLTTFYECPEMFSFQIIHENGQHGGGKKITVCKLDALEPKHKKSTAESRRLTHELLVRKKKLEMAPKEVPPGKTELVSFVSCDINSLIKPYKKFTLEEVDRVALGLVETSVMQSATRLFDALPGLDLFSMWIAYRHFYKHVPLVQLAEEIGCDQDMMVTCFDQVRINIWQTLPMQKYARSIDFCEDLQHFTKLDLGRILDLYEVFEGKLDKEISEVMEFFFGFHGHKGAFNTAIIAKELGMSVTDVRRKLIAGLKKIDRTSSLFHA